MSGTATIQASQLPQAELLGPDDRVLCYQRGLKQIDPTKVGPSFPTPNTTSLGGNASLSQVNARSNAILRTLSDRARDRVNIRDYGSASMDLGGEDIMPALVLAEADLGSAGGIIELPAPRVAYLMATTYRCSKPNVHILGGGAYSTTIALANHSFTCFAPQAAGFGVQGVRVTNFGARASTPVFFFDDGGLSDCRVMDVIGYYLHSGIRSWGSRFFSWRNALTDLASGVGVAIAFTTANGAPFVTEVRDVLELFVNNSAGNHPLAGILCTGGDTLTVVGGELIGCVNALKMAPPTGGAIVCSHLERLWCDNSAGDGLVMDGTLGTIDRNRIVSPWMSSSHGGNGMKVMGTVRGTVLEAPQVFLNSADGIHIADNCTLAGFRVQAPQIAGSGGGGMSVGKNNTRWSVSGGDIGACADIPGNAIGLYVDTGCDYFGYPGVDLRGNTAANLANGSPAAHVNSAGAFTS